ncbi:GIY-YIG nuclease family protein [Niallia taxi]|uniref:GIY-YIG nuclease family protein n=1 Tax=Niallia taxi TaxID=2499688 RepID=UPI00254E3AC8|nr:GIY-YIG nuclease family protein [Niallia taxi]MDK8643462.1 GIY-YIG nuclease family protein [Niallia taxi]
MFGTIIQDAYSRDETQGIIEALDELCNPNDAWGWASAGIYSFWNFRTKEVLYIGLAVDLAERFKQHNGMTPMDPNGCKYQKIQEYFNAEERLGYSIFVQSPLHQPVIRKNIYSWWNYDQEQVQISEFKDEQPKRDLRRVEGILIEAYKQKNGVLPSWNRVGGDVAGQKVATRGNYELIENLTNQEFNPITARYSLRGLAKSATFITYESYMHGARQLMLIFGMSFANAFEHCKRKDPNTHKRILDDDYLSTQLEY